MRAYLYGGGPGGSQKSIKQFFSEALTGLPKKPLVAYVGAASDDDAGFAKMMSGLMRGARVEQVKLAKKKDRLEHALQLLADAHAIFLSGGDVDHGMRVLRDRGAIEPLRQHVADGKRLVGVSAGSILAGVEWVRFPDDDESRAERFECLGLVPYAFDAHAEEDGWVELKAFVRLGKGAKNVGFGLPSGGGVVLQREKAWSMRAWGEPTVRVGRRGENAVMLKPLALD